MLYRHNPIHTIVGQMSSTVPKQNKISQPKEDSFTKCADENLLIIWYDDDEDLNENIRSEIKNRLNRTFPSVCIFNDPYQFAACLVSLSIQTKIFLIITSKNAKFICIIAEKRPQCEKMYQFQSSISPDNCSIVFDDINNLFIQISKDKEVYLSKYQSSFTVKPSLRNVREPIRPPPWSVWNLKITENSFQYWRKESPHFFLFQVLTRILIQMKCDHHRSLAEMFEECRLYYIENSAEIPKIDNLEDSYESDNAIWHYTQDSFLFRLVGRAFRSEDFECIFKFRRYIIDLHWQIEKLVQQAESLENKFPLYRGKKIRSFVLQDLQNNIGSLISMNGFLSTTRDRDIAVELFAGAGGNRSDYESVLFEFDMDQLIINRIYADISALSQFPQEQEVLFTIGSIWRIDSIRKINNELWWTIKLSYSNHVDSKLILFFKELSNDSIFLMLGDVLRELGQHTKAENFYYKILNEPSVNNETRATLYYNIAMINIEEGKYCAALDNLHKAEKLIVTKVINMEPLISHPLSCHSIIPSAIHIYNNMGISYQKKGDSEKALEYFRKALEVERNNPIDKATVYDNIGLLYYSQGYYETALQYLSEAVKLSKDHSHLPKFKQHYDAVNKHSLTKIASSTAKNID